MQNEFRSLFNDLSAAETEQLLHSFEALPLPKTTARHIRAAVRRRVRAAVPVQAGDCAGAAASRLSRAARRPRRRYLYLLIPAAACLLLTILTLTVPEVAQALYDLFNPGHRTSSYFEDLPADRTAIPSAESAIRSAAPKDVSYKVELLGEYEGNLTKYDEDYNVSINKWRVEHGFGELDKAEFAFLRDIRPEIREVLYDGRRLFINTYLYTDHAADFAAIWGVYVQAAHRLDATTFDMFAEMDGRDVTDLVRTTGYSTGTMMSFSGQEPADIEKADGVWLSTEIDDLTAPLPDGLCTMTLLYYIYDGAIDDMGSIGNIARIIHTFSFDATAGNHKETAAVDTPLSGEVILLTQADENDPGTNAAVYAGVDGGDPAQKQVRASLDGITLHSTLDYLGTGIYMRITADAQPADNLASRVLLAQHGSLSMQGERRYGLSFDLYVDGTYRGTLDPLSGSLDTIVLELPVFPDDYATLSDVRLKLSFTQRKWGADAAAGSEAMETVELTGCDIVIPLPKAD